jgi:hypothetical protein
MTEKPIFDRATLDEIMSTAKARRVRHLGQAWRESSKGVRWSSLGLAIAFGLTFFGAHYVNGAHASKRQDGYVHNVVVKR